MTKVLIVEDEPYISTMYRTKLEIEGMEVFVAENGRKALEMIPQVKPDVVLADIIMPDMDGLKMLEELRLRQMQVPVIMLTNVGQEEHIERAKSLGAKDFLLKAETVPADVADKIKAIINQG